MNDIFLHVQVTNEAAIAFYKKIGFEEIGTLNLEDYSGVIKLINLFIVAGMERGYYRDVTPPDCYILSKKIVRS